MENNLKINSFKAGVEATRKNIEVVEAEKAAKKIKQYGGADVYNLMKAGKMYAIVVDGVVIGGAVSEEDAKAAVEFLTHFTDGAVLDKNNVNNAGYKSLCAIANANDIIEAEKEGIMITKTYTIGDQDYVIDDTNELYSIDGRHICNVADIVSAKESGGLTEELFLEILKSRVNKY